MNAGAPTIALFSFPRGEIRAAVRQAGRDDGLLRDLEKHGGKGIEELGLDT